ncbi:NADPH-dependent FMN reductase [hydrothermal vent metagenome]|uniref:NADPH-dependent FMN reductase n=1 Tax=hydrothermal vent metagenome TaxID=652676 RepID=A0A3B0XH08_9ZZZZ
MNNIRILAVSGSLREKSYNTALINAVAKLAPNDIEVLVFDDMNSIPLFNPDRENENISAVTNLKKALKKSNGLLISSPEYAHGISGVLKNALDWLVSGDEFPYIPVALANTSPRASHAQTALREVISTMSGVIIENASITVALLGTELDENGIINNSEISQHIIEKLNIFKTHITNNDSTPMD